MSPKFLVYQLGKVGSLQENPLEGWVLCRYYFINLEYSVFLYPLFFLEVTSMSIQPYASINQIKDPFFRQSSPLGGKDKAGHESIIETTSCFSEFRIDILGKSNENFATQSGLFHLINNTDFDVSQLRHNGRSILDLTPDEAGELISEDGFYGVTKTAQRLANFVVNGAGDDLEKLKAGREGISRGFKEAEKLWGGQLPEISYQTFDLALSRIDARIQDLGGSLIEATV